MSNLTKLEFVALDISGNNYLSWILDAEIHLDASNLGETIKENNSASLQDCAKALIFLRHHLDESLKNEYLTVKDPLVLWQSLKDRYDHQKIVILPKARYDWLHLRLQDFQSVSKYNSALFKISSQLKLCGENITDEDMLEKTFTTFHASNVLIQQQYRERRFTKYSKLIACLLVAEKITSFCFTIINLVLQGLKHFLKQLLLLPHPIAIDKGSKMGRLGGKDEDVVVVEGVAVVIILEIVTLIPSKIRNALPIKGSYQIHRQPLTRISLNANKIMLAIDVA